MITVLKKQKPRKIIFDLQYSDDEAQGYNAVCINEEFSVHLNTTQTVADITKPLLAHFAKKGMAFECKQWYLDNKTNKAWCILK